MRGPESAAGMSTAERGEPTAPSTVERLRAYVGRAAREAPRAFVLLAAAYVATEFGLAEGRGRQPEDRTVQRQTYERAHDQPPADDTHARLQELLGFYALVGTPESATAVEVTVSSISSIDRNGRRVSDSSTRVLDWLHRGFPKQWVDGEVARIEQVNYQAENSKAHGLPAGFETLAEYFGDERRITFYANTKGMSERELFVYVLAHELAHANDWNNDNEMTVAERQRLLLAVTKRVQSRDRYRSSYVESISRKDEPQLELYLKCSEYWAEICAQYFVDPSRLNVADYELVAGNLRGTQGATNVKPHAPPRRSRR